MWFESRMLVGWQRTAITMSRKLAVTALLGATLAFSADRSHAAMQPEEVVKAWYQLVLELVRHTATYSPPVASRSFAYLGVTTHEAITPGSAQLVTLAGQLNELAPLPPRPEGIYDNAVVVQASMNFAVREFFPNTGPTGQRALSAIDRKLSAKAAEGLPADVVERSIAWGKTVGAHILAWSRTDGGAVIENLGFPQTYKMGNAPSNWVPTSLIGLQQTPLLPNWGNNRTFAMPDGKTCPLPPHPEYSEDPASDFHKEAMEVYGAKAKLTPEQIQIARSWSDDPMLSTTPPGHWVSIARQIIERDNVALERQVEIMARLGVGLADAFIGCWDAKYRFDLVRPVTYIRRHIDPAWEPLLITPPFPEYPSGHSTQSGAAEVILTDLFGENFAFDDLTSTRDGLAPRTFPSFRAAAEEAGISRLYGGIHFRSAIVLGLEQGRCIGKYVLALKTRR